MLHKSIRLLFKGLYKYCECGCKELILCITKTKKFAKYKHGHNGKGMLNPTYKFGRTKNLAGYWILSLPSYYLSDKYGHIREHVYFYQEKNKLCMLKWGDVHHIDGNKDNNMPWNLQGMMKGKHTSLTHTKDMSGRVCLLCGSKTTHIEKRGYHKWSIYKDGFICDKCKNRIYNKTRPKRNRKKKKTLLNNLTQYM